MADFTPGPWRYSRWGAYEHLRVLPVDGYGNVRSDRSVGDVFDNHEANARLIAQSPALYEIATGLLDISDMHGFDAAEILASVEELAEKADEIIDRINKETA